MMDEIKPIFYISDEDKELINKIEENLKFIDIEDDIKKKNLKTKSKVRSIHSSLAIEANSLSLESVSNIIDKKQVLGKPKEVQEVKNANELYENMNDYDYLSEKDFLKAHMVLMKYFEDDNGRYRNHGEGIKKDDKIIFMAPDSMLVPKLMESLFKFINENDGIIHPLILSSIFHYYFVYIHPFTDENDTLVKNNYKLKFSN